MQLGQGRKFKRLKIENSSFGFCTGSKIDHPLFFEQSSGTPDAVTMITSSTGLVK